MKKILVKINGTYVGDGPAARAAQIMSGMNYVQYRDRIVVSEYSNENGVVKSSIIEKSFSGSGTEVKVTKKEIFSICYKDGGIVEVTETIKNIEDFDDSDMANEADIWECLFIPISECIYSKNEYTWKALSKYNRICSKEFILNLLKIIEADKVNELERVIKTNYEIISSLGSDDFMRFIESWKIPKVGRDFIEKWSSKGISSEGLTKLFSFITMNEDGNNCVMLAEWLGKVLAKTDKRSWSWNSEFNRFVSSIYEIVSVYSLNSLKTLKYLIRQNFNYSDYSMLPLHEAEEFNDYLRMSSAMNTEFEKFPSILGKAHLAANKNFVLLKTEYDEETFISAVKVYKDKFTGTAGDYVFIAPTATRDLIDEGIALNHCVGSYVDLVIKGLSFVIFMRHKDNVEKSLYTIEFSPNGELVQVKGEYNADASPDIVKLVKDKFCK